MTHNLQPFWTIIRLCTALALLAGVVTTPGQPGRAASPLTQATPQALTPWDWQLETVAPLASGAEIGLALDSSDRPHLLYPQGTTLQHAWHDGTNWQVAPVITETVSSFNSLVLEIGADDSLHAVFQQTEFNTLAYTHFMDGIWSTELVTTTQNTGYHPALALDRGGEPWIVYESDSQSGMLYAAHKEGGAWVIEPVAPSAKSPALVFDTNNYPHLSYCALAGQSCASLRHAWHDGTAWQTELIVDSPVEGTSIAVAPNGDIQVAFYDPINGDLKRAVYNGVSWATSLLTGAGNVGADPQLAIDTQGNYLIAFQDITQQRLNYLQGNADGWNMEPIGTTNGLFHALALRNNDRPYLAFWDQADSQVKVAVAALKPDLALNSVWLDGTTVWAQVQNLGEAALGLGSEVRIQVDGAAWATTALAADLLPGERRNVPFASAYTCSGSSDAIAGLADSNDLYEESNEGNNEWYGTWTCDTTPPAIIAGPTVSNITAASATVNWDTDEPATSQLYWSTDSRTWQPLVNLLPVTQHEVTITGLQPASVIVYYVRSADANDNLVQSERYRIRTLATPGDPPAAPGFTFSRAARRYESYNLRAAFTNPENIERVDFSVDGLTIATDYADSGGTFEAELLPARIATTRADFFKQHEVTILAYTLDGDTIAYPYEFMPDLEYMTAEVEFTAPQESLYYIDGTTVPAGTVLPLELSAAEYEWTCSWSVPANPNGDPETPPNDCASVQSAVQTVSWWVNDQWIKTTASQNEEDLLHDINWPIGGKPTGIYTLKAVALASDGSLHEATRTIEIRQGTAHVVASRSIFRSGNQFLVTLTVRNQPSSTASISLDKILDYATGFQSFDKTTSDYSIEAIYLYIGGTGTRSNVELVIDNFSPSVRNLDPGESATFVYTLIPVLYENPSAVNYTFSDYLVTITYHQGNTPRTLSMVVQTATVVDTGGQSIGVNQSVARAFQNSDYILITNPAKIMALAGSPESKSTLFNDMAQLAAVRQGVLGYIYTYDNGILLDGYLENGGAWSSRMNPAFKEIGGGYALLVGETEVIPSFESPHFDLNWEDDDSTNHTHYADHTYANTYSGGSKPGKPELVLGRIVGNSAAALSQALQTAYKNAVGTTGYTFDRSGAVLISGDGSGHTDFMSNVNEYAATLTSQGVDVTKIHWTEVPYISGLPFDFGEDDGFASGDIDNDGWDELILASNETNQVYLIRTDVYATFSFPFSWQPGDSLAAGDVDFDGEAEIIIAEHNPAKLWVFEANGTVVAPFPINASVLNAHNVAVGELDLNHAGREIALYNWTKGRIYVYDVQGTLRNEINLFALDIDLSYGTIMTVGNLFGDSKDEYILADYGNHRVLVLDTAGVQLDELPIANLLLGDAIAAGRVWWDTQDSLVIMSSHANQIDRYYESNGHLVWGGTIPAGGHLPYDWLALAKDNDPTTNAARIYVADRHDNYIYRIDGDYSSYGQMLVTNAFRDDADFILYRGHGSEGNWAFSFPETNELPDFNGNTPLALGFTCLSGNYEGNADYGLSEKFFDRLAGAFIGATEISSHSHNPVAARKYLGYLNPAKSLARSFLDLERNRYGTMEEMWKFWVYEYNYYGDVKFGIYGSTLPLERAQAAPETVNNLAVHIPAYTLSQVDGFDYIDLPEGEVYQVNGTPRLPFWTVTQDYPAGVVVQEVSLVSQAGLTTTVGLNLPVISVYSSLSPTATAELQAPGWYPQVERPYQWTVTKNPDGTSTLNLTVYPFSYDTVTTNTRFYQDYEFNIETYTSTVTLTDLRTSQSVYPLGAPVSLTLRLENSGAPLAGLLEITIEEAGSGAIAGSLELTALEDLGATGTYRAAWDSRGVPAGQYELVAHLFAVSGELLDSYSAAFTLGLSVGELTDFSATPTFFTPGQTVGFSATFANTGDQPITGTLYIQVSEVNTDSLTTVFTQTILALAPGDMFNFTPAWDTSGAAPGDYQVSAYVKYNSRISEVWQAALTTFYKINLPVIRSNR